MESTTSWTTLSRWWRRATSLPVIFSASSSCSRKRAARAVHSDTSGVPRLVNLLLANALFVAAERGEDQIVEDTIRDLAEDRRMSLEASSHEPEAQTS